MDVFYLYKGSDGLEHGLIVALTESTTAWQTSPSLVNADRQEDGAYNTALMTDSPAATYIASLGTGWYIPSINEFVLLRNSSYTTNKSLRAGGNTQLFMDPTFSYYWSSTEFDSGSASAFDYANGGTWFEGKTQPQLVRGIRAF